MSKIRVFAEKGYEKYKIGVSRVFYGKAPKERLLSVAKYLACFFVAVFLSGAILPNTEKSVGSPLVDAFLCACSSADVFVYIGAVVGDALARSLTFSRVFTLSALLVLKLTVSLWVSGEKNGEGDALKRSLAVKLAYSAFTSLLQCLFHVSTAGIYGGIWITLLATVLALPLLTLAFSFFLAGYPTSLAGEGGAFKRLLYEISAVMFFMAVVFSLKGIRYFGVSLSSLVALILILFCAAKGGAVRGGIVGAVLGWVQNPALLLSYASVGGSAGVFYCLGALPAAGVSACIGACVALFQVGFASLVGFIPETVMAVAIASPMVRYSFIPDSFPYPKNTLPQEYSGVAEAEKRALAGVKKQQRLLRLSEALREIADAFERNGNTENGGKAAAVCSSLAVGYCDSCPLSPICWDSEIEKTRASVEHTVKAIEGGTVPLNKKDDDFLSGYCIRYKGLFDEIRALCGRGCQTAFEVDANKGVSSVELEAVADVLFDMSEEISRENVRDTSAERAVVAAAGTIGFNARAVNVIGNERRRIYAYGVGDNVSEETGERIRKAFSQACNTEYSAGEYDAATECMVFSPLKTLCASVCYRKNTKNGERCSGDSVSYFETEDGYFYALLADGMGSGAEARQVSSSALTVLKKLLACGVKKRNAAAFTDSILKGRAGECFTTLDVLEIDLVSGGASFLKNGAVASFVIRNGAVYSVNAKSMPIGIADGIRSEERSFELKAGDCIIMLSDGAICEEDGEKTIGETVCAGFSSSEELAEKIMKCKSCDRGVGDDKTVMIIELRAYDGFKEKREA